MNASRCHRRYFGTATSFVAVHKARAQALTKRARHKWFFLLSLKRRALLSLFAVPCCVYSRLTVNYEAYNEKYYRKNRFEQCIGSWTPGPSGELIKCIITFEFKIFNVRNALLFTAVAQLYMCTWAMRYAYSNIFIYEYQYYWWITSATSKWTLRKSKFSSSSISDIPI